MTESETYHPAMPPFLFFSISNINENTTGQCLDFMQALQLIAIDTAGDKVAYWDRHTIYTEH
jgi:hypothetical protein